MTPFFEETTAPQSSYVAKQIGQLQRVVDGRRRMLDAIIREKKKAEEDITKYNEEITRRVNLVLDYGNITDDLQKLGQLLKREQSLKEQLTVESEEHSHRQTDLQNRYESVILKKESLTSEIEDVTRQLEEAQAINKNAQSSRPDPRSKKQSSRKPKKNQSK